MLEYHEIVEFMKKMQAVAKELDITVTGGMTTNAYLLSEDKLRQLVELNVVHYQITVDGLKDIHDTKRFLISGRGSWDKIVQNLITAQKTDLDFVITVRTNFDTDLESDFTSYIEYMAGCFADDLRFVFYFEAIKKLGGERDSALDTVNSEANSCARFESFAVEKGLRVSRFNVLPFSAMCYASKENNLVIDVDGRLLKCTVRLESDDNVVGSLSDRSFDVLDAQLDRWTAYPLPKNCYGCDILSICYGRACPPANIRNSGESSDYCRNLVLSYKNSMAAAYPLA